MSERSERVSLARRAGGSTLGGLVLKEARACAAALPNVA